MSMERCIATLIALSFILLSPTAETAFSADKADKLTQVRMGLAARSTTSMPFFVAKERGFFREEGLDVELIVMQAIQTIQATMGNSTQFASATGSAVSSAVQGADIRVIFAVTDRPSFDLIAQPNITSVQQLRGKKIGTGGVGSLAEILARRILIANNVRPEEVIHSGHRAKPRHLLVFESQSHRCRAAANALDLHRARRRFSQARSRRATSINPCRAVWRRPKPC